MYRWVEHTAELELELHAATQEAIFETALAAFGELVGRGDGGEPARHVVHVRAADDAALLAEWLGELVFLAETEDFVPERATSLTLSERALDATVEGRRDPPAHLVKSVTYHGLELARDGEGWHARVVLDV
jgi:SHS2 domain-containing protein